MKHIQLLILASHLAFVLACDNMIVFAIKENKRQSTRYDGTERIKYINFNQNEAFIVVVVKLRQLQIYYLLGKKVPQPLRCKTAKHVMRAKNILPENHAAKALENLIIIRESHEHPSYKFQKLLPQIRNKEITPLQRMYRISMVDGEIRFLQVPLQFSELTLFDAFVFDSGKSVTFFSLKSKYPNKNIENAARNLANFIYNENEYTNSRFRQNHLKNCLQWSLKNNNCYSKFIQKLEGYPKLAYVISGIEENTPVEIPEFLQYRLLRPSDGETRMVENEFIVDYDETLANLTDTCVILINEKVQEVFIYIRDFKNEEHVKICLESGEKPRPEYSISVAQKIRPITPFLIIFREFWPLFANTDHNNLKNEILLMM